MTSGIVNTGTNRLILTNGNAPASLTYSDGFIIGEFERLIQDPSQYYLFPLGNTDNNSATFFCDNRTAGRLRGQFVPADPGGTINFNDGGITVSAPFSDGYWKFTAIAPFASTQFDISLEANGFTSYTLNTATRAIKRNSSGAWETPISGSHKNASIPYVYRDNISSGISISGTEFGLGNTECIAITSHPSSLVGCAGNPVQFSITASGTGITYQWQFNGADISDVGKYSGTGTNTLHISNISTSEVGNYRCKITAECGGTVEEYSNTATLTLANVFPALGYRYYRPVTIYHTKVSGINNLYDFPMLFSGIFPYLKDRAHGGEVYSVSGYDIIFEDAWEHKLDHQIEKYDPVTGEFIAWVRIPVLHATSQNTSIRILYGNPQVTSNPSTTDTWNSNYKGIWHLSSNFLDATSNGNNGVNNNTDNIAGKFANGRNFNAVTDYIQVGTNGCSNASGTISAWVLTNGVTTGPDYIFGHTTQPAYDNRIQLYLQDAMDQLYLGLGNAHTKHSNIQTLNLGLWYHIVLNWDGTNYEVYVNGALKASGTYTGLNSLISIADIGNNGNPSDRNEGWNGIIDEVRISNNKYTADWITTEYNNQSSPSTFYTISGTQGTYSLYDTSVCLPTLAVYTVPNDFSNYFWSVPEGTITAGDGTNSVMVNWDGTEPFVISVTATKDGCSGSSDELNVDVFQSPDPGILGPTYYCTGEGANKTDSTAEVIGNIYQWTIKGGSIDGADDQYSVTVDFNNGYDTLIVAETNPDGCTAYDTLIVLVGDTLDPRFNSHQ